jgi:shikimate kinase
MSLAERVVLIGMMGAGKSTIGASLSTLTGWPYIDNDQVVEQMVGMPTRDLMQQRGVAAMPAPLIAGAAAGIVLDPTVSAQVHDGAFVVFLRARIGTLAKRVEGTYRPWLGDDPEATLRKLYAGREPLYEKLAHLVLDVDDTTPDADAHRILEAFRTAAG